MIRKDVMKLANRLHETSGINADHIYMWLMDLGRAKSMNPRRLSFTTSAGAITHDADNYMSNCAAMTKRETPHDDAAAADFWENAILARQEAWMD